MIKKDSNKKLVLYKDKNNNIQIKVDIDKNTVWLSQKEMAVLFDKTIPNINMHIDNIYKEEELNKNSTIKESLIVQQEKGRLIKRNINYYNLDVIISVGYRVKSKTGTAFRIWATKILKQYLLKGYILNEKRLLEQQKKEILKLQDTVSLIYNKIKTPTLVGQEKELIDIIQKYTKSLTIIGQYDFRSLKNTAKNKSKTSLTYEECLNVINGMRAQLNKNNELTDLFGIQSKDEKLKGIIGAIHQTFDKKELYKTVEEKAANLLYLTVKGHPFVDGNKKIAAILFVYFLNKNNFLFDKNRELKISENTLVTLILLVSVSSPDEKDVMINLIINLIK